MLPSSKSPQESCCWSRFLGPVRNSLKIWWQDCFSVFFLCRYFILLHSTPIRGVHNSVSCLLSLFFFLPTGCSFLPAKIECTASVVPEKILVEVTTLPWEVLLWTPLLHPTRGHVWLCCPTSPAWKVPLYFPTTLLFGSIHEFLFTLS
jgi:hypothetical protein